MKEAFEEVREKLRQFVEEGEDNHFSAAISSLYYKLTTAYPSIPDVIDPLEQLQSYSNKLHIAEGDDVRKYYQLSLGRLTVLENKAEQVGAT